MMGMCECGHIVNGDCVPCSFCDAELSAMQNLGLLLISFAEHVKTYNRGWLDNVHALTPRPAGIPASDLAIGA